MKVGKSRTPPRDAPLEAICEVGERPADGEVDDRQNEEDLKGCVRSWLLTWLAAKVRSGTLIT